MKLGFHHQNTNLRAGTQDKTCILFHMGLLQHELRGKHLEDKGIYFQDEKVHGLLKP